MKGFSTDQLNEIHQQLVATTFKNFVIKKLKKHFEGDFVLIESDIDELMRAGTLREIKAKASQKVIARKKID